ncbi:MAG: GDSL-type esterase/lipase family protein [Bacillota bacterium]|jgi:acyl-CoA thioesterase-1|nr:GDSL-type esterase/lipase family protein [Bacillota bacterium]NLL59426.1 arylesterase [Tissierellia bacterium]
MKKIVCLGDSLTYGYGVSRSKVWTKLAEDKLHIEIINEGICGDTSGGMVSRFHNSVCLQKPNAVHIMGGVNDFIVGAGMGPVKSNMMAMVHQAAAKFIRPIIGIPTKIDEGNVRQDWAEFADFSRVAEELHAYRKWLIELCNTFNIKYIDYYTEFDRLRSTEEVYIDGLHLNNRGNEIMAEIFCHSILSGDRHQ